MKTHIDKKQYKGYEICISIDTDAMNPRTDFDNLGTIVTWHRHYELGDEQPKIDRDEWRTTIPPAIILPVYMYDHSGITIATKPFNDRWDSGLLGYIYVTEEKLISEGHTEWEEQKVKDWLTGEIETYDQYLRGEVYGYEIYKDGKLLDSVWGFYGYNFEESGLLPGARGQIDAYIRNALKSHFHQLKNWIRNKVPLIYRKPAIK